MNDPCPTYNIQKSALGFEEELKRLRVQATMSWKKEFRMLEWCGLQNGMSALEDGSGPGYVTRQ